MENAGKETPIRELDEISHIEFSRAERESETTHRLDQGWASYGWLLWENRSLFSKVAIRALVAATIISFLIPPKYESTSNIMPPEQSDHGALLSLLAGKAGGGTSDGAASPGLATLAGNFLGTSSSGALFVELVHSRTVEDHLIDRFNLQKIYWARYKQDARKTLEKRTAVEQDRKSGVISISVTDSSPDRARMMAQAYVEELDRLLSQVSTSSARRERIFIEQRLATVKTDLEEAERQFSAFASKNIALDIKEQSKAEVEAAAVLQGQLIAAQSELQGLEQVYTANNVRVRSLKARMDELQRQLKKMSGTDAPLAEDIDAESSASDLYPSIRKLPLLGVQWADLYRKTKIQETVYQLLNQQYELTRIQEAKEIPTIRVIDPANLPEKKSWPPRLLIITTLSVTAFLSTAVWVVACEHWRKIDRLDSRKMLATTIWAKSIQHLRDMTIRFKLPGLAQRFRRDPNR